MRLSVKIFLAGLIGLGIAFIWIQSQSQPDHFREAEQIFSPTYFKELFDEKLRFFDQEPLSKIATDKLVFRLTTASGWGSLNDRLLRIDFGPGRLASVVHISTEHKKCSPNHPPDTESVIHLDWVKREFQLDTGLLIDLRKIIESSEFMAAPKVIDYQGLDGANYLFEVRWPNGTARSKVRWSPRSNTLFQRLISLGEGLLRSPAALDPSAIKSRTNIHVCP